MSGQGGPETSSWERVLAKFEALSPEVQQMVVGAAMVVAPEAFERAIDTITDPHAAEVQS